MIRRTAGSRALGLVLLLAGCSGGGSGPQRVTLPPGSSFKAVTDTLIAHDVVSNRLWFRLLGRIRGVDRSVRAGVYEFPAGVSAWNALGMLAEGAGTSMRFTVPEGLTIYEVAALAAERLRLPADSVLAAARDGAAATRILGYEVPSFEGFLRPETYQVPVGVRPADLMRLMADGFVSAWDPAWDARLDSLKMTPLQLVTFASIIEGEARADEERETIAGVYSNRLRIGMALQADPTVQYAITMATGRRKPRLYVKDYQTPSSYNTYLNPGLPPGPVDSPSRRSLEAALNPAKVPYMYFVAGPSGRHVFTRTYADHLRAVARVRRGSG
ncbi:MAG: endolytic transglycosylase MltG, partial [Gemmatimonadales bacterium]|nr:endolytic transglycosylase MltG [Gemmatimonadales bacterium]